MKKYLILALCLAWLPCQTSQVVAQTTLPLVDEIVIDGDSVTLPFGDATNFGTAGPANGNTFRYTVRERQNNTQTTRQAATFLQFDVSGLTAAEVADPNFSATLEIDYLGHLNNINPGMAASVGLNVSGTWDSSGASNPLYAWGGLSVGQEVLVDNVHLEPNGIPGLTVDVTPAVVGWFDGSIPNQGLVMFGSASSDPGTNDSQAAYFENVSITTSTVPMTGGPLKGDVDMSGIIDFADIAPFIGVLQGGMFQAEADCDCSTVVDFGDIPAFIAILQMQ